MAVQTKFQTYVQALGRGLVDHNGAGLEMLTLSNTAPNAATNQTLADITQIANGNGFVTGGQAIGANAYSQTGGVGKLTGGNVTWTASGGSIGPFRYLVRYNTFGGNNRVISYVDLGVGGVTIPAGVNFIAKWDAVNGIQTIT